MRWRAALDEYTKEAITKTLFSAEIPGEVPPCEKYTNIEWRNVSENEIVWTPNPGYRVIQGKGVVRGRIFGGCGGPLHQIVGTDFFPEPEFFDGCILALETGMPYGSVLAGLHQLRALDAAGVFRYLKGMVIGQISAEEETMLTRFLKYEARREDIPVLANVDFVHRTPMIVLPMGAMVEIDCSNVTFKILEAGAAGGCK